MRLHLQNSQQRRNSMIITLKLLIQNTNTVPKLAIFNIIKRINCSLISLKWVLKVILKKVAVTKSDPSWSIDWINRNNLKEVLDSLLVLSIGSTSFSKIVYSIDLKLLLISYVVLFWFNDFLTILSLIKNITYIVHILSLDLQLQFFLLLFFRSQILESSLEFLGLNGGRILLGRSNVVLIKSLSRIRWLNFQLGLSLDDRIYPLLGLRLLRDLLHGWLSYLFIDRCLHLRLLLDLLNRLFYLSVM